MTHVDTPEEGRAAATHSKPESGTLFFATCPLGVADLLAAELRQCGAVRTRELRFGVEFAGELETAYRACLWSRTANRILLPLGRVDASTAARFYDGVKALDWSVHLGTQTTFAVDFTGASAGIIHTQFGALKTKDAIVDQFRALCGERPSIDVERPAVRVNVHAHRDQATISIDLSGESLHRRGYRARGVAAPLKENLAAALLLRSGWPAIAAEGGALIDPLCGSGTLLIEAAWIAARIAPGRRRDYFGFLGWKRHDGALWRRLLQEADALSTGTGAAQHPSTLIRGYDRDPGAIRAALENIGRAGLTGRVHVERRELQELGKENAATGLLICNPPYGERIGAADELQHLYGVLGSKLREHFVGWRAAVFTGNPPLARGIGLKATRSHTFFNGPIECRLLRFEVIPETFDTPETRVSEADKIAAARERPGAQMFANRLRKNLKTVGGWARKQDVQCYRLYDADMPEYSFAIDVYRNDATWVYVQEYAAPDTVDRDAARVRRRETLSVIPEVLAIPAAHIFMRVRRRQEGTSQYEKLASEREFHIVREGPYRFYVNFSDYLDTGLFLDHRLTRGRIGELAAGRSFLNLFAYTGTATVYAAGAGASSSTTVDMSGTYLDWAKRNLALNGLAAPVHGFVQADCIRWLNEQSVAGARRYDLIFIDPPTFSRSKRMAGDFDVQRDHVEMLRRAGQLLAPGGTLVFSNNYTRFKLDRGALNDFLIEDVSASTLPRDFARNPRIHCCFMLQRAAP